MHVLIGGGGHASVCLDLMMRQHMDAIGYVALEPSERMNRFLPYLGTDERIFNYDPDDILLVNGLGFTTHSDVRIKIFQMFKERGYRFATLIHDSAVIARDVDIGEGAQIMAGAVLQPSVKVGRNVIVNTRASVDHDCRLEPHVHVAPGSTLCGGVTVGEASYIGAGSVLVQNIRIGERCVIGAGSVVIRDVPSFTTVYGVPAKERIT